MKWVAGAAPRVGGSSSATALLASRPALQRERQTPALILDIEHQGDVRGQPGRLRVPGVLEKRTDGRLAARAAPPPVHSDCRTGSGARVLPAAPIAAHAQITKHLLAGVATAWIAGTAFAQVYPPPRDTLVIPAPPQPSLPAPSTTTTTTVTPSPDGDHRETTIHKETDSQGNTVTEKDVHRDNAR